MGQIVVWDHSIETMAEDFSFTGMICWDTMERIKEVAGTLEDLPGAAYEASRKLLCINRVLSLLDDSLTQSAEFAEKIIIDSPPVASAAPVVKLVATPGVNYDDFKDLDKGDIFEAMLEQAKIRDAAHQEWHILNNLLAMRQQDRLV